MLYCVITVSKHFIEYKYEIKKTKLENFINDELDLSSSDDETDNESDN